MDEPISKSQKKREADSLQKIGVALVELPLHKLELLPLSEHLRAAILEAKLLKSHGAMRRQAQLIGKLMRYTDSAAIIAAYDQLLSEASAQTANFHQVEQWREQLIHQGKEALTQFLIQFPEVDSQHLRHLIKKAVTEQEKNQSLGASKALFRFIKAHMDVKS